MKIFNMNLYTTTIRAISPTTGELTTYGGPHVPGITYEDARNYCEMNELGYCKVDGILVIEIPCLEGAYNPDWDNAIDYELKSLN